MSILVLLLTLGSFLDCVQVKDWVLCRVFQKKRGNHQDGQQIFQAHEYKNRGNTGFIDFMNREMTCSESETSVLTELSSSDSPNDETSSSG